MGWFNRTVIKKFGVSTTNFFVGVTEEITEQYFNFTSNATNSINELGSLDLKNLDKESLTNASKTLVLGYSTVCGSKTVRSKLAGLICGAATNLLY